MAEQLGQDSTVTLEEVVVSHAFEMVALITLLEKKGILSRSELMEEIVRLRDSNTSGV